MKKLENMSTQELLNEMVKTHKKTNLQPKKFKTDEQGVILLDPKKKQDRDWLDAAEDDLV